MGAQIGFFNLRGTQCVTSGALARLACQHLCHVLLRDGPLEKLGGGGGGEFSSGRNSFSSSDSLYEFF